MNKNISSIQYNSLNLPSSITYQNGNMASYVYSAAGGKLSVSYQTGTGNTSTQYCGNIIYDDNNLSQVLIDGGYITFSGTTPQYHYYLQDHLGSNRVVVNESGTAEQINHYYPFGGIIADLSTGQDIQKYKYNGKELDRMHGLNWYDYGARHFDAAIASWPTMDPLAEKYYNLSPYNYCGNNPVNAIDPNGCDWISAKYGDELFVYYDSRIKSQDDIIKHYYDGEDRDFYDIQYVGTTGTVYQNTDNGPLTYYTLNSDGSFIDASGVLIDNEVSIEGLLHIGNETMINDNGANKNWYGSYLGPNNPNYDGKYIYAIPPIDKLDYAAFQHDKGYDSKNAASYLDALFYRPVRDDDWNLARRALGDAMNSQFGSKRSLWGLGAGTLFGVLAVDKYLSIPRSALYDIIR